MAFSRRTTANATPAHEEPSSSKTDARGHHGWIRGAKVVLPPALRWHMCMKHDAADDAGAIRLEIQPFCQCQNAFAGTTDAAQ